MGLILAQRECVQSVLHMQVVCIFLNFSLMQFCIAKKHLKRFFHSIQSIRVRKDRNKKKKNSDLDSEKKEVELSPLFFFHLTFFEVVSFRFWWEFFSKEFKEKGYVPFSSFLLSCQKAIAQFSFRFLFGLGRWDSWQLPKPWIHSLPSRENGHSGTEKGPSATAAAVKSLLQWAKSLIEQFCVR